MGKGGGLMKSSYESGTESAYGGYDEHAHLQNHRTAVGHHPGAQEAGDGTGVAGAAACGAEGELVTKQQALARKAAWQKAIEELRIVSFNHGETFREFSSPDEASKAVCDALRNGMAAKVVS